MHYFILTSGIRPLRSVWKLVPMELSKATMQRCHGVISKTHEGHMKS